MVISTFKLEFNDLHIISIIDVGFGFKPKQADSRVHDLKLYITLPW